MLSVGNLLVKNWRWMAVVVALVGMGWGARAVLASVVTVETMTEHEARGHASIAAELSEVRTQLAQMRGRQDMIVDSLRWLVPEVHSIGVRLGTRPESLPAMVDTNQEQEQ